MDIIDGEVKFIPEFGDMSLFDSGSALFFDIETTGLSREKSQIYLIGCAYLANDVWNIRQYFAESTGDEYNLLSEFADFAKDFRTIVHFNGESFDIPFIEYKADFYGMDFAFSTFKSVDIYKCLKRVKKILGLPSLKQRAVEEFLGIYREDVLSGAQLIPCFYEYEKTGDSELKELLLLHNYDDMQGMLKILPVLSYTAIPDGRYIFKKAELCSGTLVLDFLTDIQLPVEVTRNVLTKRLLPDGNFDEPDIDIFVSGNLLQINVSAYRGVGKYPLPDYKDYYYLPAEDEVIHKDVAQFVNRAHRIKASKNNCYVKKEGSFLPQYGDIFSPAFKVEGDKKRTYFEVSLVAEIKADMWEAYAAQIIRHL